jgi:hypothetical protein
MHNRLGKALTCATMAASTIGLFAVPSQAASTVKAPMASPARPMYFSYGCDAGRACLRLRVTVPNSWWNVEHCGDNPIYDYYSYAIANGNGFTVYYQNGKWDYTAPWTQRTLDNTNLATMVHVYC